MPSTCWPEKGPHRFAGQPDYHDAALGRIFSPQRPVHDGNQSGPHRGSPSFASEWKVNLVLKGAPTLIVSARTGNVYINSTGNAGMACGGMGTS